MSTLNITIGQYVKGNSYLYKLDPRFKILASIVMIVAIFLVPANSLASLYALLGLFGVLVLIVLTSRINPLAVLRGLQPILFIATFTFVLQLIYNRNGNVLYTFDMHFSILSIVVASLLLVLWFFTSKFVKFKFLYLLLFAIIIMASFILIDFKSFNVSSIKLYELGLIKASFYSLRIVLLVIISTLLTISTSTTDINLGLDFLLHPLTWIKVPVSIFSMMLSLTLRFIPTLVIEVDKIMKAQASRGIDFEEGNIIEKAKQITTLLIPIFAISIEKAFDLANAMEARGYVIGAKRSNIDVLKFKWIDLFGLLFVLLFLASSILARVYL